VKDPTEVVHEAGQIALEASDKLYTLAAGALDSIPEETPHGDDTHRSLLRGIGFIHDSAEEIRRHALWLIGEAEQRKKRLGKDEGPTP
jgi:hypothetical protein